MKKAIAWACSAAILASAGFSGAATEAPVSGPQDFAAKKAHILQRMDDREQKMAQKRQEARACVQASQSNDDLKACRDKMKAQHKEARMKHQEKMQQRNQLPPK